MDVDFTTIVHARQPLATNRDIKVKIILYGSYPEAWSSAYPWISASLSYWMKVL